MEPGIATKKARPSSAGVRQGAPVAPGAVPLRDTSGLRAQLLKRGGQMAPPLLSLIALIVVWELCVRLFDMPTYLLPAPSAIAADIGDAGGYLLTHARWTALSVIVGFGFSILVGIPLAVLFTYSRVFERSIYPLLVGSQTVPKVAIAPLFVIWFGFGLTPKILIVFLISFFPIVISSVVGLKSTPVDMLHFARSAGASTVKTFWKVRLPYGLPSIFGGLRIGITVSVIGAVVGEFVGSDRGLGYIIVAATGMYQTTRVFSAVVSLAAVGITFFLIVTLAERFFLPWHSSRRKAA